MKLKEILHILPKYYDGSGYDINLKNINIPDYQNNNLDMYDWKEGKQDLKQYLNCDVMEIRNNEDQLLVYLNVKIN